MGNGIPDNDGDELGTGGIEVPVPLDALTQPDDQDVMQTPAVGDSVTFVTDAVISRIGGKTAYVKARSINGKPLGETQEPPTEDEADEQEGNDLRGMAQNM